MAVSEKISAMTEASALTGAELVPVIQGGENKQTTIEEIIDLIDAGDSASVGAGGGSLSFDKTTGTGTFAEKIVILPGLNYTDRTPRTSAGYVCVEAPGLNAGEKSVLRILVACSDDQRDKSTRNSVVCIGLNAHPASGEIVPGQGYVSINLEPGFQPAAPSTKTLKEWHIAAGGIGPAAGGRRPFTGTVDLATGFVDQRFVADNGMLSYAEAPNDTNRVDLLYWTSGSFIEQGAPFRHHVNDTYTATQLRNNFDGKGAGYVRHPHVNARNEMVVGFDQQTEKVVPARAMGLVLLEYATADDVPTPEAGTRMMFWNASNGQLQVKKSTGNVTNLAREKVGGLIFEAKANSEDTHEAETSPKDATGAKFAAIAVGFYGSGSTLTVSDSEGHTWTARDREATPNTFGNVQIFDCKNFVGVDGHTFKAETNGQYPSIAVLGFKDVNADPFDVQNGAASNTGLTQQTGQITPTSPWSLLIAALEWNDTSGTPATIDNGFSTLNATAVPGTAVGVAIAWKRYDGTDPINPTWTVADSGEHAAAIAAYESPEPELDEEDD